MAFPDAWTEEALVSLTPISGTEVQIKAAVETIDIDIGEKQSEFVPNLGGGRIEKFTPEGDTSITFVGYFVELDATSSSGSPIQGFETTDANYDSTEPLAVAGSRNRDKWRVAVLWTNDAAATTAAGATTASTDSLRFRLKGARLVSMKPSFTDGILKFTFVFKAGAFDKAGTANRNWDSGDQTALAALGTYS